MQSDGAIQTPEGLLFLEFRRKIQEAELLSSSTESLMRKLKFSGKLCVVVQNGRVLKSGYQEGYFRNGGDDAVI